MQKPEIKNQKLEVPYYSQKHDVADRQWRERACGIASLAMVLRYFGVEFLNVDTLIQEGLAIGAHQEGVGWKHDGLIALAHNHGILGYREEFRSVCVDIGKGSFATGTWEASFTEHGIDKIILVLRSGDPVIVSLDAAYYGTKDSHLVPLVGFEKEGDHVVGFYYHEPNPRDEKAPQYRFIDIETFREHWRKMAIFLGPRKV